MGSLRDREVACSCSASSHHPQEVLLAKFSLYVHKGGLSTRFMMIIELILSFFMSEFVLRYNYIGLLTSWLDLFTDIWFNIKPTLNQH